MFDDVDITNMSTDEIARKGIFLCNQLPCEIDGVTTADFLRTALNEKEEVSLYQYIKKIDNAVKDLKMDENMIPVDLSTVDKQIESYIPLTTRIDDGRNFKSIMLKFILLSTILACIFFIILLH